MGRRAQLVMVGFPQQAPSPHQAESRRTARQDVRSTQTSPAATPSLISAFSPSEFVTCGVFYLEMCMCDQSCRPQLRNDWILMLSCAHCSTCESDSSRRGIPPAVGPQHVLLLKVESMHYKGRTRLLKGHCPLLDKSCSSGIILFIC